MDADDLYDPNLFMVDLPVWFVAGRPLPSEIEDRCRVVARLQSTSGRHPAIFTDEDLANRFVEPLPTQEPFIVEEPAELIAMLEAMLDLGDTRVAFDPGAAHARTIPIERVLAAVRAEE